MVITCDGGFKKVRDLPGLATYACLVEAEGALVHTESGTVCWGRGASNLVAEFGAVLAALRWAACVELPAGSSVEVRSDCRFVIDGLRARFAVRRKHGCVLLFRATTRRWRSLRRRGCSVTVRHVPRNAVQRAHKLCAEVYRRELTARRTAARHSVTAFLRPPSQETALSVSATLW